MTRHLSDDQLSGFLGRGLAPADLLAADEHLAGCADCRRRGAVLCGAGRHLAGVRGMLLNEHLGEDDAVRFVAGELSAVEQARVTAHLRECPPCAEEVRDLAAFARRRTNRPRLPYYYAAAAVLAVGVAATLWIGRSAGTHPLLAGLESLPPDRQEQVRAALAAGVAVPPPVLAALRGGEEALMGRENEGDVFRPLEPLSSVVISDRPTFRWEPLADARAYTVAVFDTDLRPVATSSPTSETTWTPEAALPRGRTYLWQVTAERGDERVTSPAPPAPPASFAVADAETAGVLERMATAHSGSHLLLGILHAQAGTVTEAERHLRQVPQDDPYAHVARATLERLARPRERP